MARVCLPAEASQGRPGGPPRRGAGWARVLDTPRPEGSQSTMDLRAVLHPWEMRGGRGPRPLFHLRELEHEGVRLAIQVNLNAQGRRLGRYARQGKSGVREPIWLNGGRVESPIIR